MTLLMADSTEAALLPATVDAWGVYRDGRFANEREARARNPQKQLLPITVRSGRAPCDDIEPGNSPDSAAPGYVRQERGSGETDRPCLYADRSDMETILQLLAADNVPRAWFRIWVAHPTGIPHICNGGTCGFNLPDDVDGTQYAWNPGGVNIDLSLLRDDFFGTPKPPPDPFAMFPRATFIIWPGTRGIRPPLLVNEYDLAQEVANRLGASSAARSSLWWLCKWTRDRIKHEATVTDRNTDGTASWEKYDRGRRWQAFNHYLTQLWPNP